MDSVANPSYALFRMVLGFLFLWHGTQKLFNIPVDFPYEVNALSQAAGIIELVGGVLVLFGCITRPAAFICSGTMAIVIGDSEGQGFGGSINLASGSTTDGSGSGGKLRQIDAIPDGVRGSAPGDRILPGWKPL